MRWIIALLIFYMPYMGTAASPATRLITDAAGRQVRVPARADRVAALSETDLDSSLALGLVPVAALNGRGQADLPHYLKKVYKGPGLSSIPTAGKIGRPNPEALIRARPSVILTSALRAETLRLLEKIAPVVITSVRGEPWQDSFQMVAKALGRQTEGTAFLKRYQQEIIKGRVQLKEWQGKSISIVRWNPKGPMFMQRDSFASLIIRDLGLQRPASQKKPGYKHSLPLNLEYLNKIDADWIFFGTLRASGKAFDGMQQLRSNPVYQQVGAVHQQRFSFTDGSQWTSAGGPLAALGIVRETVSTLLGKKKEGV